MKALIGILLITLLVFFTNFSFAQGGWKKQYYLQNSLTSYCGNVIETPSGDLIMIGVTYDTLNGYGFNRLSLLGIDNLGNELWRKDYGDNNFEYLNTITQNAVMQDSSGFYLAICVRDSNNNYPSALLRFKHNGDTLWQKKYYSNQVGVNLYLNGLNWGTDSSLLLCGVYADSQGEPALIIKTDYSGNEIWRSVINKPFPNVNHGYSLVQDSTTKRIIVVGYQYIGNTSTWNTYSNILIIDSLGNKIHQKSFNNAGGGGFSSVVQLKDGNFLTGGSWFEQYIGPSPKFRNFLVKFDTAGVVIWDKKYDTLSSSTGMGWFIEKGNGDLLINGILDPSQHYSYKIRLTLINKYGNVKWQKYIGSSVDHLHSEASTSMNATHDGGYILSSWFQYLPNPKPYSIIKIDSLGCDTLDEYCKNPLSVDEFYNKTGFSFEMFPNPARDIVNLKFSAPVETTFSLEISDVCGKILEKIFIQGQQETQLRTLSYNPGIYFVAILSDGRVLDTKKLIIQK